MPMSRYEIRNEYTLADPELYLAADKDDPEALLEGVAMAGLVGVLRQLGDLAEFAADIFHNLHEEVIATTARSHAITSRIQQLEIEIPSIERFLLSQSNHSSSFKQAGIEWHPVLREESDIITKGDLPRFVRDSYEQCRPPPSLFLLDKFDVGGAGTCLKRYTDPSFFKVETSGKAKADVTREKKIRKPKKKGPRQRNTETSSDLPMPHTKLHQLFMEERVETVANSPSRRAKPKTKLNGFPFSTRTEMSYMEKLLNYPPLDNEVVHHVPTNSSPMFDRNESGLEIVEVLPASPDGETWGGKRSPPSSPDGDEIRLSSSVYKSGEIAIDDTMFEVPDMYPRFATGGDSPSHDRVAGEKVIAMDGDCSLNGYQFGDTASDVESDTYKDSRTRYDCGQSRTISHIKSESLISYASSENLPARSADSRMTVSDEAGVSSRKEMTILSSDSPSTSYEHPRPRGVSAERFLCGDIPGTENFLVDQHSETDKFRSEYPGVVYDGDNIESKIYVEKNRANLLEEESWDGACSINAVKDDSNSSVGDRVALENLVISTEENGTMDEGCVLPMTCDVVGPADMGISGHLGLGDSKAQGGPYSGLDDLISPKAQNMRFYEDSVDGIEHVKNSIFQDKWNNDNSEEDNRGSEISELDVTNNQKALDHNDFNDFSDFNEDFNEDHLVPPNNPSLAANQINLAGLAPLPPLPPVQWRLGKLQPPSSCSDTGFIEHEPLFTLLFSHPALPIDEAEVDVAREVAGEENKQQEFVVSVSGCESTSAVEENDNADMSRAGELPSPEVGSCAEVNTACETIDFLPIVPPSGESTSGESEELPRPLMEKNSRVEVNPVRETVDLLPASENEQQELIVTGSGGEPTSETKEYGSENTSQEGELPPSLIKEGSRVQVNPADEIVDLLTKCENKQHELIVPASGSEPTFETNEYGSESPTRYDKLPRSLTEESSPAEANPVHETVDLSPTSENKQQEFIVPGAVSEPTSKTDKYRSENASRDGELLRSLTKEGSCEELNIPEMVDFSPKSENKQPELTLPASRSESRSAPEKDRNKNGSRAGKQPLPHNPMIEEFAGLDKIKLRRVAERVRPQAQKVNGSESLLEQIRSKSFNLRPASTLRPSIRGPSTNLRVAAIVEKANAIRQALADSDEDDDSWSDS